MLGDFCYYNPTRLYFGENSLDNLKAEMDKCGENILLVYGGGSVKRTGLYQKVVAVFKECGKNITEDGGVMPNPTVKKLYGGIEIARASKPDFVLAVGGGSVCDYTKALCASVYCEEDPWEKFFVRNEYPENEVIPWGCILTMAGTGSEMNLGSVITNTEKKLKYGFAFDERLYSRFSILNPVLTYTLPKYQMLAGIYDIFNHICEQYFAGEDDNTSDYIMEGLMRSVINSSRIAAKDPENYEARSNIMWSATWALNSLVEKGKKDGGDGMVHNIGQSVGAYTDATHGMTLAAVSVAYYKYIMPYGLHQFKKFAKNVWGIAPENKTDEELALAGINAMADWMKEIGLVMNITDLGATEDMLPGIAKGADLSAGGYKTLSVEEILDILKESM